MGIAVSTYGAHERAEAPGGRDYGPDEAKRYARRFQVTPEWLLTGRGLSPTGEEEAPAPKIQVVGYVGAGSTTHFYDVAQGNLDEVSGPACSPAETVAVEIRGDSLGSFFNRWLVFYDDVRRPLTPDLPLSMSRSSGRRESTAFRDPTGPKLSQVDCYIM